MDQIFDEAQAIAVLKQGDHSGFEVLYNREKRRIYCLCLRMVGDPALAEEMTQETFLTAFRRISTFRGDSRFSTWLYRIAVNCVLMHIREQRSRISETSLDEVPAADESASVADRFGHADSKLEASLDRVVLERAIAELPPGYRIVVVLHDIEGYEHNEIAALLGCSVGNTKSQLHKARIKLRRILLHRARELRERPAQAKVPAVGLRPYSVAA